VLLVSALASLTRRVCLVAAKLRLGPDAVLKSLRSWPSAFLFDSPLQNWPGAASLWAVPGLLVLLLWFGVPAGGPAAKAGVAIIAIAAVRAAAFLILKMLLLKVQGDMDAAAAPVSVNVGR